MFSAWMVPALIGFLLDVLVIGYLIRGPLKRFIFVFCYCVVEAVVFVIGSASYLHLGPRGLRYENVFWGADLLSHALITLILIFLIRESLGSSADLKRLASWVLPVAIAGVAIGSVLAFRDPTIKISVWMTPVTRNLSFAEEILNFMLWTALIRNRDYDRLLLFISAGIGIQVTGEVIGHTIRTFMQKEGTMIWLPDTLLMVSEIVCLLTWVWAFGRPKSPVPLAPPLPRE
jgi:hypothetical protein